MYFAGQSHPAVQKTMGNFATNKKTNAFGKSDLQACQHVFLSAVIELQDRARKDSLFAKHVITISEHDSTRTSVSAAQSDMINKQANLDLARHLVDP